MKKPQLKPKEIARCLNLVHYHHSHCNEIKVEGELLENFGGDFSEDKALEYYQNKVMGRVGDTLGREVVIDEEGIDFLYDEHKIESGNYRQARGKRLPWIKHTIQNSKEIYEKQEHNMQLYIYVSKFIIHYCHTSR